MSMGRVQQIGTPLELYDRPANLFVASFIGLPPMNFFEVLVSGDKLIGPQFEMELSAEQKNILSAYQGKHITLGVRPENVVPGGSIPVRVQKNENLGMNTLVHGHIDNAGTAGKIVCKFRDWCEYKENDLVNVSFDKVHFFDNETTNAITGEAK